MLASGRCGCASPAVCLPHVPLASHKRCDQCECSRYAHTPGTPCIRMFTRRALCNRARFPCACPLLIVMKQTAAAVLDDSCKGKQAPLTILKDFPVKEPQEV